MLKKKLAMLLAATMCLTGFSNVGVFGAENNESQEEESQVYNSKDNDLGYEQEIEQEIAKAVENPSDEYIKDNDPLYDKYMSSNGKLKSSKATEILGTYGSELTHDACFANKSKTYGVDVSYWQGSKINSSVDWTKVKASGIDFAIIRLGYRGSDSGTLTLDTDFETNIKGAIAAGLKVGVYFFTNANDETEAAAEAKFCAEKLADYSTSISFPIMYDIESGSSRALANNTTNEKRTALCKAFCQEAVNDGYKAGVYSNKAFLEGSLTMSSLSSYFTWCARYASKCEYFTNADEGMWQYSSSGSVDGISGSVDMDVYYGSSIIQTAATSTSVTFSWGSVSGATGYEVVFMNSAGEVVDSNIPVYKTSDNSITIDNLTVGTKYKAKVRPYFVTEAGTTYGDYTEVADLITQPKKVSGIEVTEKTDKTIGLSWKASAGAEDYQIQYYDLASDKYVTIKTGITETKYTISENLLPATKYRLRIRARATFACGTKKYGARSNEFDVYTQSRPVTGLNLLSIAKDKIGLSWDVASDITGYEVMAVNVDTKEVINAKVTDNSYVVTNLLPGNSYIISVRTYKDIDENSLNYTVGMPTIYGEYTTGNYSTKPDKVANLVETASTTSSITLGWDASYGAEGYYVYSYNNSTKKGTKVATVTSNSAKITGLTKNTKYCYYVVAYNTTNETKYKSSKSSKIEMSTSPDKVTGLVTKSVDSDYAKLKWNKVSDVSGYNVLVYSSKNKLLATYTTKKASYTLDELDSAKAYKVVVRAFVKSASDQVAFGKDSDTLSLKMAPEVIKGFSAKVSKGKAVLSWDKTAKAKGYKVYRYNSKTKKYDCIVTTSSLKCTVKGLVKGKTYKFIVRSYLVYNKKTVESSDSKVLSVKGL